MASYKVDPLIPLAEFGSSARELNESFLVGAVLTFARSMELEDYLLLGLEYSFEKLNELNKTSVTVDPEGNVCVESTGEKGYMTATGTVVGFFQNPAGLFIQFEEILKNPAAEVVSNCWKLSSPTWVLFQE